MTLLRLCREVSVLYLVLSNVCAINLHERIKEAIAKFVHLFVYICIYHLKKKKKEAAILLSSTKVNVKILKYLYSPVYDKGEPDVPTFSVQNIQQFIH
ncbi:hypothetical protein XELAEV_18017238mg [Xenopus laevis]|uniref:Uncharacterized protein n=1 Tax=Xenopus laevis TaxID=8355 RepID=A0A974HSG5_XENLA|nr:hypothetical protein XELAEV_18017238mg [Xenopus laevis]